MAQPSFAKVTKKNAEGQIERRAHESEQAPVQHGLYAEILRLQQTAGNEATEMLLQSSFAQSEDSDLQAMPTGNGGASLHPAVRSAMEARFDADFANVRIHTDEQAEKRSASANAKALTEGSNIYFNADYYQPDTGDGRQLIAHELTHVIQQLPVGEVASMLPVSQLEGQAEGVSKTAAPMTHDVVMPGTAPHGMAQAAELSDEDYTVRIRGTAGERGVGVLYVQDWNSISPQEQQLMKAQIGLMDQHAEFQGGFKHTKVTKEARKIANQVADFARGKANKPENRGLELYKSKGRVAGHMPDTAASGNPVSVIGDWDARFNSSIGGQWRRYKHGFVFTGFVLYDRKTGKPVYMSGSQYNEAPPIVFRKRGAPIRFDVPPSQNAQGKQANVTVWDGNADRNITKPGSEYDETKPLKVVNPPPKKAATFQQSPVTQAAPENQAPSPKTAPPAPKAPTAKPPPTAPQQAAPPVPKAPETAKPTPPSQQAAAPQMKEKLPPLKAPPKQGVNQPVVRQQRALTQPIQAGSMKGDARGSAAQAIAERIKRFQNDIAEAGIRNRIDEELAKNRERIAKFQTDHPDEGVLIAIEFTKDTFIDAPRTVSFIHFWEGGRTEEEAIERYGDKKKLLPGGKLSNIFQRSMEFRWIPPGQYVPMSKSRFINGTYQSDTNPTRRVTMQFADNGTFKLDAWNPSTGVPYRVEVGKWQLNLEQNTLDLKAKFYDPTTDLVIESEFRVLNNEWLHEKWSTNRAVNGDQLWHKVSF